MVPPHFQDPILACPWPSVLTLLPHAPNSPNSAGKLVNLSFEPCHLCGHFFQDLTPNGLLSEALPHSPHGRNRFAPHCSLSIIEMQCWIHAIQQTCRWQAPFWAWGGEQWAGHGPIPIRTDSDNKHINFQCGHSNAIKSSMGSATRGSPKWLQGSGRIHWSNEGTSETYTMGSETSKGIKEKKKGFQVEGTSCSKTWSFVFFCLFYLIWLVPKK